MLIGQSNRYLSLIVAGEEKQVVEMVYWPDFSDNGNLTLEDFHKEFIATKNRWPLNPAVHPLLGLQVVKVSGGGNYGDVLLAKDPKFLPPGAKPGPEIRIWFIWAGTGWVVREDSLFGKGKFFSELPPRNPPGLPAKE